eukprot:6330406-Amphidinium_carterae.1
MFCVSNEQGRHFVVLFICSASLFVLAARRMAGRAPRWYRRFARARSAWYEASRQQSRVIVASCVLVVLYNRMTFLACTVVSDHLRFNFLATGRPLDVCFALWVHMSICMLIMRFHCRHATQRIRPCHDAAFVPGGTGAEHILRALPCSLFHAAWLVVCVMIAAPGILYSAVNAVPGFLNMSVGSKWIVSHFVSLGSGLVLGFGLSPLASLMCKASGERIDRATLQLTGQLLASILLPWLVTVCCHAECL